MNGGTARGVTNRREVAVDLIHEWSAYSQWLADQSDVIPIEDRCFKCDGRRVHEGCKAGLCEKCCAELRAA